MFGESDLGESPRVPSPWEAILSVTPPKLVPEADQGNIEYKLQLLSPSPARFARLVTQLKWRLLEGGGQAYYELGVADSGALVGLRRSELERTLETLECMAGEIGASVIVVREIEVPKGMRVGVREAGRRRRCGVEESPSPLTLDASPGLFPMDSDPDVPALTLTSPITVSESEHSTDLEISTVYKPRPIRLSPSPSPSPHSNPVSRSQPPSQPKWYPKTKHPPPDTPSPSETHTQGYTNAQHRQTKQQAKALYRRLARDRRRVDKQRLNSPDSNSPNSASTPNSNSDQSPPHEHPRIHRDTQSPAAAAAAEELVHGLETLHVTVVSTAAVSIPVAPIAAASPSPSPSGSRSGSESGEPSLTSPAPSPCSSPTPASTSPSSSSTTSTLPALTTTITTNLTKHHIRAQHNADGDGDQDNANANVNGCVEEDDDDDGVRLIVEALVVRKLSLEEAFLDFGGFSLI
ncbi:hypothetical protein PILCRDRAFT_93457 [Piloderma croceum F 1598]|uniref:GTP-binding protein 2 n=1 Tax=Piloderma croceum (strain F 1598) TaxID=765440 RepID=A0A0C3EXG2_PILCF|nr:hypothetical protein PILCRDRAFT_93457 [Piloderma croceum F 1598]